MNQKYMWLNGSERLFISVLSSGKTNNYRDCHLVYKRESQKLLVKPK